ncbi:hypothetical protein QE152_g40328 [Popillia japonica]|uniref:Uncharacterized protein n=1 Tax=Popillia japonica TaxID=7064 RepID=A0AAW1HS70_POPJA
MATHLFGSGCNISAHNWFTDIGLKDDLKKNKFSYVGTLRKNKLPPQFVSVKRQKQYTSMFGFSDRKALESYIPKMKRNGLILPSFHDDNTSDLVSGEQKKPDVSTILPRTALIQQTKCVLLIACAETSSVGQWSYFLQC